MSETKVCCKCERELLLGEFSVDNGRDDGRQRMCKGCIRTYQVEGKKRRLAEKVRREESGVSIPVAKPRRKKRKG